MYVYDFDIRQKDCRKVSNNVTNGCQNVVNQEARSTFQTPLSRQSESVWFQPGARTYQPVVEQNHEMLPILQQKSAFLNFVSKNQAVIVTGETGSGKTTQIPQYLVEAGYARNGCIGCTLPRRIAASSVAIRVSEEVGCKLGSEVGYAIRFEDCTSSHTIVKYMTEGVLLAECLKDPDLRNYSVIMLDDAHERTINIDLLFGLLKGALSKRPNLKLIVSSATLDSQKFSTYFNNAATLNIPGRLFPVDVVYTNDNMIFKRFDNDRQMLEPVIRQVIKIHRMEKAGDVLVFLPGQEDVDALYRILSNGLPTISTFGPKPFLMKLYGMLISEQQLIVFEHAQPNTRKIIITTNVAESSVTIQGIVYVVDSGLVKQKNHHPAIDADEFQNCSISRAQAVQRAGRAGRTGPGICYRLYSKEDFEEMLPSTAPEVQRSNLASLVLKLKLMGVRDIFEFPFMNLPSAKAVSAAVYNLILIGAMRDGTVSGLGKRSKNGHSCTFWKHLSTSGEKMPRKLYTVFSTIQAIPSLRDVKKFFETVTSLDCQSSY